MKAAVLQRPRQIEIKEVPDPIIEDYDVLCKTLAASICGGTDNHIVRNHPYFKVTFPTIVGHEGIGQVITCGNKVRYFKEGDLITRIHNKLPLKSNYAMQYGAFAEKSVATDWQAMRDDGLDKTIWGKFTVHRVLPPEFDPIASTMIITWRETRSFLDRMKPASDNIILIIGSGANALSFANHTMNSGIETIIIGSPKRKLYFSKLGIDIFIPYHGKDPACIIRSLGCKTIDVIIDTIGKSEAVNRLLPVLSIGGKVGVYGLDSFNNYNLNTFNAAGDFAYYSGEIYDEGSAHDAVIADIINGKLYAWDYLSKDHIYPLEKINEALDATFTRKTLKSVIKFDY